MLGTKVDGMLEMINGKTSFNLFATTLEISLYNTLQREMGLNSVTFDGFFFLGINMMKVVWTSVRLPLEFNTKRMAL